ncbi:MAG TPA: helix-turn-helix transcriptional regulator [Candidatus Dojkabacteria bacterium]|nr:helix-turn-helix transcriptional regulator [Candidatus Dojkabacteria bacterium]
MKKYKLVPWREVEKKLFTQEEIERIDRKVEDKLALRALRDLRNELSLTQEELAIKSGIPRTTISKVENGQRNISIYKLVQIANSVDRDLQISFVRKRNKK